MTKFWETTIRSGSATRPSIWISPVLADSRLRFKLWVKDTGKNWAASWVANVQPHHGPAGSVRAGSLARMTTYQRFVNAPADFDKQVGFADTFSRNFQAEDTTLFPSIDVANYLQRR